MSTAAASNSAGPQAVSGREGGLRWFHWVAIAVFLAVGACAMAMFATVPLAPFPQALLGGGTIALFLVMNRSRKGAATLFLAMLSVAVTSRYLFWRISDTLDFDGFPQAVFGLGLIAAEIYALVVMMLGYIQTIWPLNRKPVSLPPDGRTWPSVDVFIPTYSEDLSVVRPTVLAALAIDWPRDRLKVYILDDGRRPEFQAFAMACGAGYITRSDNRHAKAGNLNNALSRTSGEYVAVFDCDHVPTNAFLELTMGWLVRDPTIAFVQTPHHFYTPDPIQRNLSVGNRIPAEGNIFYGLVQDGNDLWNAAFFCGSCAVLRRKALESIGGFAVETVTEDAHTALRMHRAGWNSAYLRLPLAAGLGTDRLIDYVGQRMRWARGMIQIFRSDNPLFRPGLSITQRLCYFSAMTHFFFAFPRVVLLTAPLVYLLLGQSIIAASPLAMISYAIPHLFHASATNARINRHWRHSIWSEVYETLMAVFLVPVTIMTLINPKRGKFNVTRKNVSVTKEYFDFRAVYPNIIVAGLLAAGVARGLYVLGFGQPDPMAFQALILNTFWAVFSLVIVLAAIAVGRETPQVGNRAPVPAELPVVAFLADGRVYPATSRLLSMEGAELAVDPGVRLRPGARLDLEFDTGSQRIVVPATVRSCAQGVARTVWRLSGAADEQRMVQVLFGRADAWLYWAAYRPDRPFASLWDVFLGVLGLFRPMRRRGAELEQVADGDETMEHVGSEAIVSAPDRVGARVDRRAGRFGAAIALLLLLVPHAQAQTPAGQESTISVAPGPLTLPDETPSSAAPATPPALPVMPAASAAPAAMPVTPAPSTAAAPPAAVAPSAASVPVQGADERQVVWTLHDLGAAGPMRMQGDPSFQGVQFGIRDDQVVVNGKLTLSGAISPSLIPELTNITVTLNDQYIGTIPLDPKHPQFGPIEMPLNPVFFTQNNHLSFRFTGRYSKDCNNSLSDVIWAEISDASSLAVTLAGLPAHRDLARLPLPFFDKNALGPLNLPFVLSPNLSNDTARAAGMVASWFGELTAYRGANFPVAGQPPVRGSGVLFVSGDDAPAGLALPPVNGPTLAEVPNPNDPSGTLLVIAGRTGAETVDAAKMLVLGAHALSGTSLLVTAPHEAPRRPYDAPGWIPTDRPVRLGELVETSSLQGVGLQPPMIHVPFHTAPDLVTWRRYPFTSTIDFRAPPSPIVDVAASRLDVLINGQLLGSYSLAQPDAPYQWIQRFFGETPPVRRVVADIPTYAIGGENDLQLSFKAHPAERDRCAVVSQDIHTGADPNSTIDLSRGYHFGVLPNLAWFASSGFPFSRMADLSDTAVVLADQPSAEEISAYLNLMAHIASETRYPVTNVTVVRASGLTDVHDDNLLLLGTLSHMAPAAGVLSSSPYAMADDRLAVKLASPLAEVWRLFGDTTANDRVRASADLATALSGGSAAMIGAQSPYHSGRSVVALLSAEPAGVLTMVDALRNPRLTPNIRGDLVLLQGGQTASYRGGPTYTTGHLPIWLRVGEAIQDLPAVVFLVGALAAAAMAMVLSWILPWQSRRRLGAAMPERGQ